MNSNTGQQTHMGGVTDVTALVEQTAPAAMFPRFIDVTTRPSDYGKFASHMVQFHHVTLTSANNTSIVVTTNLLDAFKTAIAGTPVGEKLKNFNYTRSPLCVRIVVQGATYAAGKVVATFMPAPSYVGEGVLSRSLTAMSLTNCMVAPHLCLDPSKVASYDIELPVCTTTGVWDYKDSGLLGSYIMTLNFPTPIFSGTAVAPSVAVCTYVGLKEPALEGITLLSGDFEAEKKEGGVLSSFVYKAGEVAPLLAVPFPELGPGVSLFSKVAGAAGDFLKYLGFSKPPGLEIVTVPTTRNVDNWSQYDGKSNAIVLGGSQAQSLGLSAAHGGGTNDELLFGTLCAKKALIKRASITAAMSNGSVVTNLRVSPTNCFAMDANGYTPSPLAGCALPFDLWSGDIIYTFEVVASIFHRATILIAWDVRTTVDPIVPPTLALAQQALPNKVITISGNSITEIRVPWAQTQMWGRVHPIPEAATTAASLECFNGTIYVYVINALTSNGSTDPIALNIYAHSDNIRFAVPECNTLPHFIGGSGPLSLMSELPPSKELLEATFPEVPEESGGGLPSIAEEEVTLLSNDFATVVTTDFGPKTDLSYLTDRTQGEVYNSIKQLTSKLTLTSVDTINLTVGAPSTVANKIVANVPIIPCGYADPEVGTLYQNYLSWFAAAFLGYRGSIRHVFHLHVQSGAPNTARPHSFISHLRASPPTAPSAFTFITNTVSFWANTLRHYAATGFHRDLQPTSDVVAPSLSRLDFTPRGNMSSVSDVVVFYQTFLSPAADTVFFLDHCTASGDDGNFIKFLGFPRIQ